MSKYLVVHTPGAFGNFLAWIIDCHRDKKIGDSPFTLAGSSHDRKTVTPAWDIIMPARMSKYKDQQFDGAQVIGIHWPQKFFPYILHASIERTNTNQYGKSGVAYAEENFYDFTNRHQSILEDGSIWMQSYLPRLKEFYNFDCNENNPTVPRIVLRNLFWMNLAAEKKHIWTTTNQLIERSSHEKISLETILDYTELKAYMEQLFGYSLDFSKEHAEFIRRNRSLSEYILAMDIVDATVNNRSVPIPQMSVLGECIVMWYLEKHYFDINFFNLPFTFTDTKDILQYVAHYPTYMKQPNKFFQTNWRDFQ